jgi:hypothetical protein
MESAENGATSVGNDVNPRLKVRQPISFGSEGFGYLKRRR